ncbi:MAG: hypothetical protein H8E71_00415 [Candidatus Marinimicrobia bacterium]|nr:hypothetical protein [Candidatus Neomarinimicrobiota bacterium]
MPSLKLDSADLRKIFKNSITVKDISSKFAYKDGDEKVKFIKNVLITNDYDVMGIKSGSTSGYILINDLTSNIGKIIKYIRHFEPSELISETTPLVDIFQLLKEKERIFVLSKNKIDRIVTRSDLQKAPVRMLIFGFISILEMYFLSIIKKSYQNESWIQYLTEKRVENAKIVHSLRKEKNEALELVDCIQISDKRDLLLNNKALLEHIGFNSKTSFDKFMKKVEKIRDKIAHSHMIDSGMSWRDVIDTTIRIDWIIEKLENRD